LGAERLGEIGHLVEVTDVTLVQPLEQLARAKRLFAHALDERLQLGARQAEQVRFGCHGMHGLGLWAGAWGAGRNSRNPISLLPSSRPRLLSLARAGAQIRGREEIGDLGLRVLDAVGAVYDILFDAGREIRPNRALVRLLRIGRTHEFAV